MTKGELLKALELFADEVEIYRPTCDRNGEEWGEIPIHTIEYIYNTDTKATILLK
jgi:hypothetical protein